MADRRGRSYFLPILILAGVMLLGALLCVPAFRCDSPLHSEFLRQYIWVSRYCPDCRDTGRLSLKGLWDRHRSTVRVN